MAIIQLKNTRPPDLSGHEFTGPRPKSLALGGRSSVKFEPWAIIGRIGDDEEMFGFGAPSEVSGGLKKCLGLPLLDKRVWVAFTGQTGEGCLHWTNGYGWEGRVVNKDRRFDVG